MSDHLELGESLDGIDPFDPDDPGRAEHDEYVRARTRDPKHQGRRGRRSTDRARLPALLLRTR